MFFFPSVWIRVLNSPIGYATCTLWFNLVWWEQPARGEEPGSAWLILHPPRVCFKQWLTVRGTHNGSIQHAAASGPCIRRSSVAPLAALLYSPLTSDAFHPLAQFRCQREPSWPDTAEIIIPQWPGGMFRANRLFIISEPQVKVRHFNYQTWSITNRFFFLKLVKQSSALISIVSQENICFLVDALQRHLSGCVSEVHLKKKKTADKSAWPPFDGLFGGLKPLFEMCKHCVLPSEPGFPVYFDWGAAQGGNWFRQAGKQLWGVFTVLQLNTARLAVRKQAACVSFL